MDRVVCRKCATATLESEWLDCDTYCETCGWHTAHKCPCCDETYDDVWEWPELERIA